MSLFVKSIFLLFVFTLVSERHVLAKTHVSITNNLEENQDLNLHCKSADDDLGMQVLHFNQTFAWSFGVSVFWNTQFYCSFLWKNAPIVHYDMYIATRDESVCKVCNWYIKEGGPCRYVLGSVVCIRVTMSLVSMVVEQWSMLTMLLVRPWIHKKSCCSPVVFVGHGS
ncbi:Plant self-incompatibility S1 [Spatholobus suberectus]|nr:Plant self-incompatibility S1 [Spatholobus suberectus]